jgi:hypothetical protein
MALTMTLSANAQEKLIILNEGNWNSDNGKISYFENNRVVSNQWFRDNNSKKKLGDTPNDIIQINNDLIAIAVNWSNIIQFITPEGKAVAATEDVPNNRCLATDGNYLYVSSYGHECATTSGTKTFTKGFVAKIDVSTFKVIAATEVGYEPEGITYYDGYLFVANSGGYSSLEKDHEYESTVSVLNASTMQKVKDIDTGQINLLDGVRSGQYFCISSPGDYYSVSPATIIIDCKAAIVGESDCYVKLDYASTYASATADGNLLVLGSTYSYITGGYETNYLTLDLKEAYESGGASGISEDTYPGTMLDDVKKLEQPYGLYVNPYTGYIYATDAATYVEGGQLYQWDASGKLLGKYELYINPGHFLALPPNGEFNAIENVTVDTNPGDNIYYNLQGMRVSAPTKGSIYIHNGKKILY